MTDSETEADESNQCQYCGTVVEGGPGVVLDIQIFPPEDGEWRGYYARYLMCSLDCRNEAQRDPEWLTGDVEHRKTVHKSEAET